MKNKKILLVIIFLLGVTLLMPMFNKVFAVGSSNAFDAILTNGKLVINSVPPTNSEQAAFMIGEYVGTKYEDFWADVESCNEDFTACDITYNYMGDNEETRRVEIVYNYDSSIKTLIDSYTSNFPTEKIFEVKDLELINYWMNYRAESEHFEDYSSELKSYVNYANFDFAVDNRAGEDSPFLTARIGVATLSFKDKVYFLHPDMGVKAEHIIYVPDNTGNTAEALAAAAQKRIDDYIGINKAVVSAGGDITEYFTDYYEDIIASATNEFEEEQYQGYYDYFLSEYNNEEGEYYFLHSAAGNYYFNVEINGINRMIMVVKDSEKMITPTYKTADISTNVRISSTSSAIPLDTNIRANKISSGTEYEDLIETLKVADSETYDLRLYSGTLSNYVTKLEDGTFEVRIPLASKYNGKDLVIYYVDAKNKITEYEVEVKDGFAVFNTNHFSIYTLAEKPEKDVTPKTGIENNLAIFSIICMLSVAGVVAMKKS